MSNLPFNIVDGVVIPLVLLSALFAFFRGFTREVLAIGAWIGAAFTALYLFPTIQPYARSYIPIQIAADVVAGGGVFLAALLIYSMLTNSIASGIQRSVIGPLDRTLGFVFGLARGLAVVSIAYLVVSNLSSGGQDPSWLRDAKTLPIIQGGAAIAYRLIPADLRDQSLNIAREVKHNGDTMIDGVNTLDALKAGAVPAAAAPAAQPTAPAATAPAATPVSAAPTTVAPATTATPGATAPAPPGKVPTTSQNGTPTGSGYAPGDRRALDQLFHTN